MMCLHIITVLLLLYPSFLCFGMEKAIVPIPMYSYWFPEKKFVNFPSHTNAPLPTVDQQSPKATISLIIATIAEINSLEKNGTCSHNTPTYQDNVEIEKDFFTKWGCNTSTILVKETTDNKSIFKAVDASYLNNKNPLIQLEKQDTFNPQLREKIIDTTKTVQNTNKTTTMPTAEELKELVRRKLEAEKLILQQTLENQKQKDEIASLHKKNVLITKKIESNHQATAAIKKEIAHIKAQTTQQKKPVAPPNKKSNTEIVKDPNRPEHNPNTNVSQQKLQALRYLFKDNNVKTEAQLKSKLANECYQYNAYTKFGRFNYYWTWKYTYRENGNIVNRLEINTDDCPSSESSSEEEKEQMEDVKLSSTESYESSTEEESSSKCECSSECECSSDEDSSPH